MAKSPYWEKVKNLDLEDVPDTYLDWLMGQPWFIKMTDLILAVQKELSMRRRSHYYVPDAYGKTLEDI